MYRSTRILALGALVAACTDTPTALSPEGLAARADASSDQVSQRGEIVYGLTPNNQLLTFSSAQPNRTLTDLRITGLAAGETVVGIDFRPSDLNADGTNDVGKLYGVTLANRLYVIDPVTGAATNPVTLSTAISGTIIGFGFNPVVDRIRIHTADNQNLRINPDNGVTIVDVPLAYAAGDANFGVDPDVSATGYTNNDNNPATGTELYALDAEANTLVEFSTETGGPNGGQLITVGRLGVNVGLRAGFDISVASGTAYAALATSRSGKSTLYSVDLQSGKATRLGLLAQTKSALLSIAVKP